MELPTLAPKFMQVACECPKTCVMLEHLHLSAFKCVDVLMQVSARTFMQLASKLTASWLLFHTLAKGAFCEKKKIKKMQTTDSMGSYLPATISASFPFACLLFPVLELVPATLQPLFPQPTPRWNSTSNSDNSANPNPNSRLLRGCVRKRL